MKKIIFSLIALVCVCTFMFIPAEIFFRVYDHYSLTNLHLVSSRPQFALTNLSNNESWSVARKYLTSISHNADIKNEWFFNEPTDLPNRSKIADPDLQSRLEHTANFGAAMGPGYVWNFYFLQKKICQKNKKNDYFPGNEKQIFAFKPLSLAAYPSYRFLSDKNYPDGLVTNAFGFRGKPLTYLKPANTIRIAFVGASTTIGQHGSPFSYPELVEYWLNKWASSTALPVLFEIISAGRSGITSSDIAAMVQDELIYLAPDIIVYYEGSNQFWPKKFINYNIKKIFAKPSVTFETYALERYSAFFVRLRSLWYVWQFRGGGEPFKPPFTIYWPTSLNEKNPDIYAADLPVQLPVILSDWDKILTTSRQQNIDFIPTSFLWLAHEGMKLDLSKHMSIYIYLNRSMWPFSYQWIRRMADFQNRAFEIYAKEHHLDFIDFAKYYPQDPDLFFDAIHMTYEGVRLQAWMMFNKLVPILNQKIASGQLPKLTSQPVEIPLPLQAAITPYLVSYDEVKASCLATAHSTDDGEPAA